MELRTILNRACRPPRIVYGKIRLGRALSSGAEKDMTNRAKAPSGKRTDTAFVDPVT